MSEQGRKYDGGKLRYDLIPVLALEEMVKGLTYGTIKYDDNNWIKVPNGRKRYLAAALRHIQEYRKGNLWDEEQNIHHLSAAMNNLSFIVEKDLQGWEDTVETVFETEEDFFEHGKEIAKELDAKDISQEELEEYVTTLPEQKQIQCEHCTHGWLPWPLSAKREGSPCHMCKNGEVRKTLEDDFSVLGNGKIAVCLNQSEVKLWYPPVEDGGNPWIEYGGRGQPVSDDTLVKVVFVNDRDYKHIEDRSTYRADEIQWLWSEGCEFNVVSYSVVG